ncbi:MAG: energy transducer TonB [Fluviicola sp.]
MKPFSIETPCHEDWTKMQIARDGRHCLNCQKNVVDFTQMERHEILEYLFLHKNESVCGRIYKDQIDIDYTYLYVTIEGIAKQSKNKSLPFYLLTTLSLYLASCEEEPKVKNTFSIDKSLVQSNQLDTVFVIKDTVPPKPINGKETIFAGGAIITTGSIISTPTYQYEDPTPKIEPAKYNGAIEKHACYSGGFSSLKEFITENLNYPTSELKKGKKGVVFIQFDILEDGKLKNLKAIKNTTDSKILEDEAKKVVLKTSPWIPTSVNDVPVRSTFVLPISFDIKKY